MKNYNIWGIIKNYKWKSVFFRYWALLIIILLIPFSLFTLAITGYFKNIANSEMTSYSIQSLNNTGNILDSVFSTISNNHTMLSSCKYVSIFLTSSSITDNYVVGKTIEMIYRDLQNFKRSSNYIHSVYLYSPSSNYILSTENSNSFDNFLDKSWYDFYKKNGNYILSRPTTILGEKFEFVTICKEIYYNHSLSGVLVINMYADSLLEILNDDSPSDDFVYLVDNKGNIILSTNKPYINTNINSYPYLSNAYASAENSGYVENKYSDFLLSSKKLSSDNYTVIKQNYNKFYLDKMKATKTISILTALITALGTLLLSFYISMKFYNSIAKIIVILQNPFERGNTKKDQNVAFNELMFISKNILNVMDKNSEIESELTQRLLMLKKIQSIALQTQINPHFLFNSLQLINVITLSELKKDTRVTKISTMLSDILRYALETKEYMVDLRTEIEYLKKYIAIQNIRYDNMFSIIWNIEENTLYLKTIKLILQPIVENALIHGIIPTEENGKIIISSSISDNILIISITNNGEPLIPEKLLEINKTLNSDVIQENNNIGLSNVNQRIKLAFGDEYGCNINSNIDQTTTVVMKMPKVTK